jgi:hypothetical protein
MAVRPPSWGKTMLLDDAEFQEMVSAQPANKRLVTWLKTKADPIPGRSAKKWPAQTPLVRRHPYALHTHPDLGSLLMDAAESLPGHYSQFAFGYDVVANSAGVVCAVATGMNGLIFRLPEQDRKHALKLGALPHPELDAEWVVFDAWRVDTDAIGQPDAVAETEPNCSNCPPRSAQERKRIAFFRYWCDAAWAHANAIESTSE